MTKLTALKQEISEWERIVAGTGADSLDKKRALCQRYGLNCRLVSGEDCPVAACGYALCIGSPYDAWATHHFGAHDEEDYRVIPGCASCLRFAKAELRFLRSLLPKG